MTHVFATVAGTSRRQCLRAAAAAVFASGLPGLRAATAAPAPTRRLLCSGPAGSIPDIVARAIGAQLPVPPGAAVMVDNRPGAAGQLSVQTLKGAAADGATLLLAQGALATIYPFLYARLGYDPVADLQPVTLAAEMPIGLAVGPRVPAEVATLADFLGWLRRHPDDANLGSPGSGTLPHLLEAMLMREAGVPWQHVPYAGGPPAMTDLLGGRIAALALPEGLLRQHHASGRLRVLATSGAARSAYLPQVPSFAEAGHPGLVVTEWFAFFAGSGVPKDTIAAASSALQTAIASAEVAAAFAQAGMTPAWSSPESLAQRIAAEQRQWPAVIRALDIRVA